MEKTKKDSEEVAHASAKLKEEVSGLHTELKRVGEDHAAELESQASDLGAKLGRESTEKKRLEEALGKIRSDMQTLQGEYNSTKETLEEGQKHSTSLEVSYVSSFFLFFSLFFLWLCV